jgi:hypothetical protein
VSFTTFSQISKGAIEPEARYPMVWSWLLLLFLFHSFDRDQGSNAFEDEGLRNALRVLKHSGLLDDDLSVKDLVNSTAEKSLSLKLNVFIGELQASYKTAPPETDFPFAVDRLKRLFLNARSASGHLLVIDGFDELLRRGTLQYDALAALIFEVNRLNMDFVQAQVPAKIVLLCRTDLFERLPCANKNKIRQNAATNINWYASPEESALIKLIDKRASLSAGMDIDVLATYFPSTLRADGRGTIRSQILEQTRHVPRDMIMLLNNMQAFSGDQPLTSSQIATGLAQYSRDYFIPEITDELTGYLNPEQISMFMRLLGATRKIRVSLGLLEQQASRMRLRDLDVLATVRVLFECSAVGTFDRMSKSGDIQSTFKYRNPHASLDERRDLILHRALWSGLGARWDEGNKTLPGRSSSTRPHLR